jgi:hypothetical protein
MTMWSSMTMCLALTLLPLSLGLVIPSGRSVARSVDRAGGFVMTVAERKSEFEKASFDTSISEIPKCPLTKWDAQNIDITSSSAPARTLPLEIHRSSLQPGVSEEEYIAQNKEVILQQLTEAGAVWVRGFEMMKTTDGFQRFYQLLELEPCQDPLASVGARAVVNKKSAMYEAVNKPSRARFFVGMHNESTNKRTNRLGAFVCFKRAETGGEFLLLDGLKMMADIKPDTLQRLYERGVRFSNAELPFFDFLRNAGPLKPVLQPVFKGLAELAVGAKIDMELELRWDENERDGLRLLAFSPPQSPVNRHPLTGEPAWFCNVHSHSRYLRDKRDGDLPETSGSSKLNRTNMFYGDLSEIDEADLREIDDATMRNLVHVPMQQGDVVLVDNYQVMHGRAKFTGERLHAVTWFQ